MKAWSRLNLPFFALSLVLSTAAMAGPSADAKQEIDKKALKAQFKSLSTKQRDHFIQEAAVTRPNYKPEKVAQFDILADMKKHCGNAFDYAQKNEWPQLECRYHADNGSLGGYSRKFLCDFPNSDKANGYDTRKVKYAHSTAELGDSEVIETMPATILSKLIGFYAETYCPVSVRCVGCPSDDPWKGKRASAAAKPDQSFDFPWTIIEKEVKSITMANRDTHPRSQGVMWDELGKVQTHDPALNRQMRIEREAWMLWMSFLQASDAAESNNRLSCLDYDIGKDGTPTCAEPILYTHDYGMSFYMHLKFDQWNAVPALRQMSDGKSCRGSLQHPAAAGNIKGLVLGPVISAEARDLLVARLKLVTDDQLQIIHQVAKFEQSRGISLKAWIDSFHRKIAEMESTNCSPLDAQPGLGERSAFSMKSSL